MPEIYEAERQFFDGLYQLWAKTSGAEDTYWMPEQRMPDVPTYNIWAVNAAGEKKRIASLLSEEDADFITAIHGAFGDIIRRVQEAFDEADSKDYDRDSRECEIARLELEKDRLESLLDRNRIPY
jgi:hypothetical protein